MEQYKSFADVDFLKPDFFLKKIFDTDIATLVKESKDGILLVGNSE